MEIAERIQTSLLPNGHSKDIEQFEIAAAMKTADEVGGDYYDYIKDVHGNSWFAIGDVTGHGVTPGLIMMIAQTDVIIINRMMTFPCCWQSLINLLWQ